ncbi:ventricular natriuretic peptide-like [Tyto alba]|uniref:ventricular natriuretic peptide-like n=1 Tax=Tyto alba TaxID=56313 RepID=UPI001403ACC0|nr:ventricular natriuretic peptide-like [Tyto alba]
MQLLSLCCGASLLLLVLPWAGVAGAQHSAELRSLQDLLEALGQLREEEGEPGLEDEPAAGAEDGGSEWDLPGVESSLPGTPLPAPSPPQLAEEQSQWRSLLSSYRRRHFSGCFGMRMERIGAQTGLGCNQYKIRLSIDPGQGIPPRLDKPLLEGGSSRKVIASFQDSDQCSDPPHYNEEALSGTDTSPGAVAASRDAFPNSFTAASCESSQEAGAGLGVNSR